MTDSTMKQFPWRDFVWLTVLAGLAIGLTIESRRVREYSSHLPQVERWEMESRELIRQVTEKSGARMQFTEGRQIRFTSDDGVFGIDSVNNGNMRNTRERSDSILTGMTDLDVLVSLIAVIPLSAGLGLWLRKTSPSGAKAYSKFSVQAFRWMTPFSVLMFASFSVQTYCNRLPFFGAFHLTFAVLMLTHYIANFHLRLTSEAAEQIDKAIEKPIDSNDLKKASRFPLRDFFWATMVIGLSVVIVREHRQAVELSVEPGRAEWWEQTAVGLQEKLAELDDPKHRLYRLRSLSLPAQSPSK